MEIIAIDHLGNKFKVQQLDFDQEGKLIRVVAANSQGVDEEVKPGEVVIRFFRSKEPEKKEKN